VKSHKIKTRIIKVLPVAIVLLIIGLVGYRLMHSNTDNRSNNEPQSGINYDPPTDEEAQAGDKIKDDVNQKEKQSQNNPDQSDGAKQEASVIITDAGQYDDIIEVRAFIPNHYQDGTCTITLTKDTFSVSKSTPAYRDATTTICTNPLFARSEFATPGEWSVTVSYSSSGAQGTSSSETIDIR
jgi:hypothetical protein